MNAYKFLRAGRVAPFTAFRWEPGVWVEAEAAVACVHGVHACRREDLPYWLQTELWAIELDGEIVEAERKLVASRGRLIRRIDRWDRRAWTQLARACTKRTRALAKTSDDAAVRRVADDAELVLSRGHVALVPYFASVAAERAAGPDARLAERAAQAEWLAEHVLDGRRRLGWLRR
jgi:hypothetical protein